MNKYSLVIFDVDGTLLDTTEGVIESVKFVLQKYKLDMPSHKELLKFIGPPIQASFMNQYRGISESLVKEMTKTFRDTYKDVNLLKAVPYEGIYVLCDKIIENGMKIAVATYKRQDYAVKLLQYFGFDRYSNILYGADNDNQLKKKDIIELAIQDSGIQDYNKVVMVGDSSHDAIGAEQIGIDFIGVTYGFEFKSHDDVNNFKNIGIVDNALEIFQYL